MTRAFGIIKEVLLGDGMTPPAESIPFEQYWENLLKKFMQSSLSHETASVLLLLKYDVGLAYYVGMSALEKAGADKELDNIISVAGDPTKVVSSNGPFSMPFLAQQAAHLNQMSGKSIELLEVALYRMLIMCKDNQRALKVQQGVEKFYSLSD